MKSDRIYWHFASPETAQLILQFHKLRFRSAKHFNDCYEHYFDDSLSGFRNHQNVENLARELRLQDTATNINLISQPYFRLLNDLLVPRVSFHCSKSIFASIGISCFSLNPDNPLMWSHYAAKNTGFCLGFKRDSSFLSDEKLRPLTLDNPCKVTYSSKPYSGGDLETKEKIRRILSTKNESWGYEDEVRAFRVIPDISAVDHLDVEFDRNDLSYIVASMWSPIEKIEYLYSLDLGKTKKFIAIPQPNRYGFRFLPLPKSFSELKPWLSVVLNKPITFEELLKVHNQEVSLPDLVKREKLPGSKDMKSNID